MTDRDDERQDVSGIRGFVAEESTASEMARAVVRVQLRSGTLLRLLVVLPLACVLLWIGTGNWGFLIGLPVVLMMLPVVMFRGARKQLRSVFPPGARLETEFQTGTITIRTPTGTAEFPLSTVEQLRTVGDFVVFQRGSSRIYNVLPRGLFPEDEVARHSV